MPWTAEDFMDTQSTAKNNTISKTSKGKWTAEDFMDTKKPSQNAGASSDISALVPTMSTTPETAIDSMRKRKITPGVVQPNIKDYIDSIKDLSPEYKQSLYKYAGLKTTQDNMPAFQKRSAQAGSQWLGADKATEREDTGNAVTNLLADALGVTSMTVVNPGGTGTSLLGAANKFGTKTYQKVLEKLPTKTVADKGVKKVVPKLSSQVAAASAGGAAGMAPISLLESRLQNKDLKETGKKLAVDTAIGAGLGVAGAGVAKGLQKGFNKLNETRKLNQLNNIVNKGDISNEQIGNIKPQPTNNTLLPKPQSKFVSSSKKEKIPLKDKFNNVYTKFVDSNFAGKKVGEEFYTKATNSKSVGGIVDNTLTASLRDAKGNKIGSSLKEVVEQIPKGKEDDFWTYMSHRHNIDRAREGKNVQANYTSEMSAEAVRRYELANPQYKQIGNSITNWIDDFMRTWGVKTGIVDKDVYATLRNTYKSYFPTQRDFSTLENAIPDGVSRKFVDQSSPIKKATGSERDIINPVENIMNLVNRTVRTAKYNEVGKTLLDQVRKSPEKMKLLAEEISVKDDMFSKLDNVVTVLENGKPTYLQINDKALLDMLKGLPKNITNIKFLSSATNLFKQLITQKNPIFAIRNIARDIPTSYVYGSEGNPLKFARDLYKAGKDIISNSENFQRYKSVGGGGGNFFNIGDTAKSASELTGRGNILKKIVKAPIEAIGKFNNFTETVPRLAEFNRVYATTGNIDKALYAANDVTVNFSRGGNVTKTLDRNGVAYLNAGAQGLDKFFRSFSNPKTAVATLAKAGVAISTPEVALYLINKDNPNYQALDNRTKDAYYLIPREDGTFWKIPKSRELGVLFGSLLSRVGRYASGEKEAFKGFGNAVATNFAPTNPIENNILAPAFINLPKNKDFADRAIVPMGMTMDGRSKYLQYDEKTTEISKKIAEYAKKSNVDISPKQLDYLIKSYTGVIGQFAIPLNTQGGKPLKALTNQFIADPIYSNQAVTNFYDNFDKLKQKATDKNILEKLPSKRITPEERIKNNFNKASLEISELNKKIRAETDENKIRELRIKILDKARKANEQYPY